MSDPRDRTHYDTRPDQPTDAESAWETWSFENRSRSPKQMFIIGWNAGRAARFSGPSIDSIERVLAEHVGRNQPTIGGHVPHVVCKCDPETTRDLLAHLRHVAQAIRDALNGGGQ